MSQKSPASEKIVIVLKWIVYVATAIISFIGGTQV